MSTRSRVAAFLALVQFTVARGRVTAIDASAALAVPGVLAVLTHENAPRLGDVAEEIAVLQSDRVQYVGQPVAAVVAETSEVARDAAGRVEVRYDAQRPDVELRTDRDDLYPPGELMGGFATDW